jgi:hypothetical protein
VSHSKEAFKPPVVETEYTEFEAWWAKYVQTLNQRATLVWQEIAWAGWYARSEIAENKALSIWARKEGE